MYLKFICYIHLFKSYYTLDTCFIYSFFLLLYVYTSNSLNTSLIPHYSLFSFKKIFQNPFSVDKELPSNRNANSYQSSDPSSFDGYHYPQKFQQFSIQSNPHQFHLHQTFQTLEDFCFLTISTTRNNSSIPNNSNLLRAILHMTCLQKGSTSSILMMIQTTMMKPTVSHSRYRATLASRVRCLHLVGLI